MAVPAWRSANIFRSEGRRPIPRCQYAATCFGVSGIRQNAAGAKARADGKKPVASCWQNAPCRVDVDGQRGGDLGGILAQAMQLAHGQSQHLSRPLRQRDRVLQQLVLALRVAPHVLLRHRGWRSTKSRSRGQSSSSIRRTWLSPAAWAWSKIERKRSSSSRRRSARRGNGGAGSPRTDGRRRACGPCAAPSRRDRRRSPALPTGRGRSRGSRWRRSARPGPRTRQPSCPPRQRRATVGAFAFWISISTCRMRPPAARTKAAKSMRTTVSGAVASGHPLRGRSSSAAASRPVTLLASSRASKVVLHQVLEGDVVDGLATSMRNIQPGRAVGVNARRSSMAKSAANDLS